MRVRVQFILFVREPQPAIRVEHLLAQRREEFFEDAAAVNTSPKVAEKVS